MRTVLSMLLLAAVLEGCAAFTMSHPAPLSAPGPCGAEARQRLDDAIMAGTADGYERAIFNNAYQACQAAVQRYGHP